jgi:hypothetical protein
LSTLGTSVGPSSFVAANTRSSFRAGFGQTNQNMRQCKTQLLVANDLLLLQMSYFDLYEHTPDKYLASSAAAMVAQDTLFSAAS